MEFAQIWVILMGQYSELRPMGPELEIPGQGSPLHPVHQQLGQLGSRLLMIFGKNFNEPNGSSTTPGDFDFP